jgi:DNA-binding IscR family transcriptional regulator
MPNRCLVEGIGCERRGNTPCRVHEVWRDVQTGVVKVLEGVTIEELAQSD